MADHKQLLHQLLKENQEPFRLKNYIAERRSQLKNPAQKTVLQIKKQRPIESAASSTCFTKPGSLCKQACFLSFQNSPEVRRSPFPSPLKSPCKSPRGGDTVFLHVPARTAAMLVEAAKRIQKQRQSKTNKAGFGLFGSLLERLKDRSKNKKRAIVNKEILLSTNHRHELERKFEENVRISCSFDNRAAELEAASTSSCGYRSLEEMVDNDFISEDMLFCESPFRFSLRRSPSCSGSAAGRTPEFCSPAASPCLPGKQENENYITKSPKDRNGEDDDEEKEHCSPVSILDPPFEDEDSHESEKEAEEDDYDDMDGSSYANVQRAKQQLLYRLRRFEKLAGLDPVELERKMLDSSDEEFDQETVTEPDQDDHNLSRHDTFLMSINLKNLVTEPVVKEKGKIASTSNKEVVFARISNRLGSWKEVEFDTIDRMIDMDFKMDFDGWNGFQELVEEIAAEFELELFGMFVEELHGELFCMDHGCK